MALRNIRTLDDDILRKKSKVVKNIDNRVLTILEDMAETMYSTGNGAGLAAPQVGILKRLVVIDMGEGLIKLINPEVIKAQGIQKVTEGCLSVPGKWGELERPAEVKVKALNEDGEEFIIDGKGDLAKCLCHEIDHLNGILFIDRVKEFVD